MPCTAAQQGDPCFRNDPQTYTIGPNRIPSPNVHYANMGWVGFVLMNSAKLNANSILRVTSADINLSQEITMPDVIDGRIDKTVYQLGPKIVEGSLSLPLVADIQDPDSVGGCPTSSDLTVAGSLLQNLWCWTTARGPHGRLLFDDTRFDIRFANHAAFIFDNTIANSLSFSVAQGDAVTVDINVFGRGRQSADDAGNVENTPQIADFLSPARVLTWNDVTVNGVGPPAGCGSFGGADLFFSNQVREWNLEINNNADRFYSLQGSLFPVDVNVGKREITGSLTLLGLQDRLRVLAQTNQDRFTEKNEIRFAFYIGGDTATAGPGGITFAQRDWAFDQGPTAPGNSIFARRLTGVVFQIEEMEMRNEVFETTVNYLALGNDQENYEAIAPVTSCSYPAWEA